MGLPGRPSLARMLLLALVLSALPVGGPRRPGRGCGQPEDAPARFG